MMRNTRVENTDFIDRESKDKNISVLKFREYHPVSIKRIGSVILKEYNNALFASWKKSPDQVLVFEDGGEHCGVYDFDWETLVKIKEVVWKKWVGGSSLFWVDSGYL